MRDHARRRAAIVQPRLALLAETTQPLRERTHTHTSRLGSPSKRPALLLDPANRQTTTTRTCPRVTVQLHPEPSLALVASTPPSLQGEPDGTTLLGLTARTRGPVDVSDPFDLGLTAKVAIVTGAGSRDAGIGNGRAAAILLAHAGANVLAVDRDGDAAAETARLASDAQAAGEVVAHVADVTSEGDCVRMVAAATERWGRLDVLDNNVGIGSRGSVVDQTRESWEHVMTTNVTSMVLVSKHAIPAMQRGGGGAVVNVASIAAMRPRGLTAYTTSKGAIISLTRAMAFDHGPDGIRVNCVAPGPAYTPMVQAWGLDDEARAARRRASVLDREGTGWDVGNAVVFLASERAAWITGQTLIVDGGVTLCAPERGTSGERD